MKQVNTTRVAIGLTAFAILISVLLWAGFTKEGKGELQKEREYNQAVTEANRKASEARNRVFCEEYVKFGNKDNTPPAYKHCLDKGEKQ